MQTASSPKIRIRKRLACAYCTPYNALLIAQSRIIHFSRPSTSILQFVSNHTQHPSATDSNYLLVCTAVLVGTIVPSLPFDIHCCCSRFGTEAAGCILNGTHCHCFPHCMR